MSLQRTPVSPLSRSGGEAGRSLMIPRGVGAPPPPGMDPRRGKLMCIKVRLLDDSVGVFHLGHKALGQALFDEVCRHLNLLESDYFGLEFADCYGNHCWLDKDKAILRQITTKQSDARFYFIVKFYTPNPADLEEEYTRYLLALQIRRDLATGEMICNENTAALLASYIVQADCGDFSPDDYPDHSYLASGRFLPNQTADFQRKVMENHQKLTGMGPGESDLALLETARRCDFYGVKLHAAKDVEGTDVSLTVAHLGIRVFHQLQCVSTFSWAKIRKLSFKRRKLLIKLHPESYQYYKETIEFSFDNRNECKNFWKKCVEHHAFFRCAEIELPRKSETRLFSRGSSFRYHGRTQKQLIDYVREHRKRREPFTRPIKPGLSSRSERISRPALYNVNSGYSTVSDRAINVVTGIPPSSVTASQEQAQPSSGSVPRINGHHHAHHHHQTPQQPPTQQAPNVSDAGSSSSSRGSHHHTHTGSASNTARTHRHHHHSTTQNHTSGAMSDGERMCASDMETGSRYVAGPGSSRYRTNGVSSGTKQLDVTVDVADPLMSLSLPNVLGEDVQLVCREFELKCDCPPKSASGDNFLEMHQPGRDYDNLSEESYRLSDHEQRPSDALYATTFTAKRVGNVIVKRIVSNTRSTPNTTDDEDPARDRSARSISKHQDQRVGTGILEHQQFENTYQNIPFSSQESDTVSSIDIADKRSPGAAEYPQHRKLVPVEIDGPNVNLEHYRQTGKETSIEDADAVAVEKRYVAEDKRPAIVRPMRDGGFGVASTSQETSVQTVDVLEKVTHDDSPLPLQEVRKTSVIYTSTGAILQKPKIIPDVDTYKTEEAIYSQVKVTQAPETAQVISHPQTLPKTYGAVGPLRGRVITKENLVITPDGVREKRTKPAVPPKPKNYSLPSEASIIGERKHSPTAIAVPPTAPKPTHPIVNMQQHEMTESGLSQAIAPEAQIASTSQINQRPTLISIQSEDRPDIQKCHLFNSDIPYVLTMRNISSVDQVGKPDSTFSTFKDPLGARTLPLDALGGNGTSSLLRNLKRSRSPESLRRRKSLDLVPRNRLPSPGNFSSQDHSISPTTPESGDVLEYLLRRRSASNERSALAKKGRRGDPRRQTQPVRFNLPPSPEAEQQKAASASQPNLQGDVDDELEDMLAASKSHDRQKEVVLNRSASDVETFYATEEDRSSLSADVVARDLSEPLCGLQAESTADASKDIQSGADTASAGASGEKSAAPEEDEMPPPPPPLPRSQPPSLARPPMPILMRSTVSASGVLPEPLPPPPPAPPPPPLGSSTNTGLPDSRESLPFADESVSSRASFASGGGDTSSTEQKPPTSATLRTPTGVLWTDF